MGSSPARSQILGFFCTVETSGDFEINSVIFEIFGDF